MARIRWGPAVIAVARELERRRARLFAGPLTADTGPVEPSDGLIRSAAYRRLRPWIIRHGLGNQTIVAIKLFHTAIFFVLMSFVLNVAYSGVRNRFTRRTALSLAAVVAEGFVVTLNRGRCPLTVVVEDLGAEHGSVSDIFLPRWVARHIPHISTALLGLGLGTLIVRRGIYRR